MPNLTTTVLKNPAVQKNQVHEIELVIQQTAGTQTYVAGILGLGSALIVGDTNTDFTQAAANTLLGVDNDVITATVFGSTAMGTDALGYILAMNGQVASVVYCQYSFWLATEVANMFLGTTTAPTDALTEVAYKTPAGNIAGRVIPAGFDAGTGLLQIKLGVILK